MNFYPYPYNSGGYLYNEDGPDCNFGRHCKEGWSRINNYYKKCAGPVYICRDACFEPYTNSFCAIGPWKSCGICIGGYAPMQPFCGYPDLIICCYYKHKRTGAKTSKCVNWGEPCTSIGDDYEYIGSVARHKCEYC